MNDSILPESKITVAVTAVVGLLAAHQLWTWFSKHQRLARLAPYQKIDLLPLERGPLICKSPATSTITYFKGNPAAAAEYFSARVDEIVTANPWLLGKLDRDENGVLVVFVPPAHSRNKKLFSIQNIELSSHYHTMVSRLSDCLCGPSEEVEGTDKDLWKVTLIPDGTDKFALVVSANHSFLDGHGYYKMYNMLSSDTPIQSLSPFRKMELLDDILEAQGGEVSFMTPPPGFLFRFIGGVLRNALFPATQSYGFTISKTWIALQKKKQEEVPFVSSNDVLVSTFCRALDCDVAMMAMNFRGKVAGAGEDDLGNYEDLMAYRREDYATPGNLFASLLFSSPCCTLYHHIHQLILFPILFHFQPNPTKPFTNPPPPPPPPALIRKSVTGPIYTRAAGTALPSNLEHLTRGTYGAITNWASFARLMCPATGATQTMHVPLFDFPKSTPGRSPASSLSYTLSLILSLSLTLSLSPSLSSLILLSLSPYLLYSLSPTLSRLSSLILSLLSHSSPPYSSPFPRYPQSLLHPLLHP
jgi:hypothetical protein